MRDKIVEVIGAMSLVIEKISEIGVKKIVPIVSTFSERFTPNYSRLKKIALEAVEQSEGMNIPTIEEKKTLKEIIYNYVALCSKQ